MAGSVKLPNLDIGWINTCKPRVASHSCHPFKVRVRHASFGLPDYSLLLQSMFHPQPTKGPRRHVPSPAPYSSSPRLRHITTRSCTLTSHSWTGWWAKLSERRCCKHFTTIFQLGSRNRQQSCSSGDHLVSCRMLMQRPGQTCQLPCRKLQRAPGTAALRSCLPGKAAMTPASAFSRPFEAAGLKLSRVLAVRHCVEFLNPTWKTAEEALTLARCCPRTCALQGSPHWPN